MGATVGWWTLIPNEEGQTRGVTWTITSRVTPKGRSRVKTQFSHFLLVVAAFCTPCYLSRLVSLDLVVVLCNLFPLKCFLKGYLGDIDPSAISTAVLFLSLFCDHIMFMYPMCRNPPSIHQRGNMTPKVLNWYVDCKHDSAPCRLCYSHRDQITSPPNSFGTLLCSLLTS